jgi:hypothetical protein
MELEVNKIFLSKLLDRLVHQAVKIAESKQVILDDQMTMDATSLQVSARYDEESIPSD